MKAEIVTIGDEILIGQIIDTNSVYISKQLNKIGVSVHQITSIQDDREHILKTLKEASSRVDIVIVTGGLGPTKDDITKKCLCEFFDDELVMNPKVLQHIEELFEKYIDTPISKLNRDQALLPSKAIALHNEFGTAAGMWFQQDGKVYISMPGVPYEMRALMENEIIPRIQTSFSRPVILHKTVITLGLGESAIAERIEAWEDQLPKNIKLAYLPNLGRVRLRLSARGTNQDELERAIDAQIIGLKKLIGEIMYSFEDEDPVEVVIAKLLEQKGLTLSIAESCTGGRLSSRFTDAPGSSKTFTGGVVCYATESKIEMLGVPQDLIKQKSVVSAEVAKAMAEGVRRKLNTSFAVSTTGNAGPEKGDSPAEVGTVFIGLATPHETLAFEFMFGNHREKVIGKTVNKTMQILMEHLLKFDSKD